MAIFRLILLVSVLGGLILLLVQNWTPAVALVFLGMQTQALPLAMWILLSAVTGGITTLAIASLFKLSSYFGEVPQRVVTSSASRTKSSRTDRTPRDTPRGEPFPRRPVTSEGSNQDNIDDDWDFERNVSPEWDFETNGSDDSHSHDYQPQYPNDDFSSANNRPDHQSHKSDSTYSYSARKPKNSGVSGPESVYDADYRVIVPPYTPDTTSQTDDDDDWSFFDEVEDTDKSDRPK